MANQITDNRTLLFDGGDGTGGQPDSLAGVAVGTADTSTFLEGSSSYTISTSNSVAGMLFDAGSAQNWSNNTFYVVCNSGVVGLQNAKASAGFTIRFCGAAVTDWFEVYVGGNDSWPESIQGGWTNFAVDIEKARADAIVGTVGGTNGTTPATSAVRYIGVTQFLSSMPKMADNLWLDTIHRLPDATPGIIIEGRNGGSTDWDSVDILTELGSAQMAFRAGAGGSYVLSTPIQFGINDTSTHGFTDTNNVWLWDNQEFAATDLYGLSALGNSGGTTNVAFGIKTGSGDDATGAQGNTISAASNGVRWAMDFNDPNLDVINLSGCSFIHGGAFLLDNTVVSVSSSLYIDCTSALVTGSKQARVSIIAANTADGVAFMTTDDLGDIVFSSFSFSDGHAVELTTPITSSQNSKGNTYTGYGITTSNDAAIYNNTAGAVTINVIEGGTTPTYRDGTSASTTIVAGTVTLNITLLNPDGTALTVGTAGEEANVLIEAAAGGPLSVGTDIIKGLTTNGLIADTRSYASNQPITGRARKGSISPFYKTSPITGTISSTTGLNITVQMISDE